MSGDLLSSGIGAEKFSANKFKIKKEELAASQSSQNYNYFSELGQQVNNGDIQAAQQAMAISLFSVQNDGSDNSKNLKQNNNFLEQIKLTAQKVIDSFKEEQSKGDDGDKNQQQNNSNQNGLLAPSIENVNEIKKILAEQGDDDITDDDIVKFLETNPEFSE